jgi:hypothetical protein
VLQQGLIGYITVGVDPKAKYDPNAAWKVRLLPLFPFLRRCADSLLSSQAIPDKVAARMAADEAAKAAAK